MTKHLLLIAGVISLLIINTAKAQTDSAHYDLGRIQVNKNFTQSVSVKASDIERYQFNYITDALEVYFYGTFTNSSSVVYVIDGNIVNDVNAYNIQDVAEITLVQSALAQVSGAAPYQQMVLIKTRRGGPGRHGITASDQTSLVNARNNLNYSNANKPAGFYDQAYLGAYQNYSTADIGISAGFLHNVSPQALPATYTGVDPFHYGQLRLNAYADKKLWAGSSLSFAVTYTPQVNNAGYAVDQVNPGTSSNFIDGSHESQHLFNTNITLSSRIIAGLTNTLSAGYNHYNDYGEDTTTENLTGQGISNPTEHSRVNWYQLAHTLIIKDNLRYHRQIGEWSFDPSLNFMYRHVKDTLNETELAYQDGTPVNTIVYSSYELANYNLSLLTPSADIYYKNVFDVQGGFTGIMNKENTGQGLPVNHLLPFVSASLNVARLRSVKLRLFVSYARQNVFMDDPFVSLSAFILQGFENPGGTFSTTAFPVAPTNYNLFQSYNNYQAGLVFNLSKDFAVSYNFHENFDGILAEFAVPTGPNGIALEDGNENAKSITNRIAINYNFHSGKFNWVTGLNTTETKLQLTGAALSSAPNQYLADGHRWTGGFTNRFSYHRFFAGLDVLYQLGERPTGLEHWTTQDVNYIPPSNTNSFSLQNLYLGTQLKIRQLKYAEIYLNTRNILQNKGSDITDERRFYGMGIKINL